MASHHGPAVAARQDRSADAAGGVARRYWRELTAQKKAPRPNRRARRALKSKKSTNGLIGDRTPTPAQINGYRPKTKPSTLRGGYGTGR